MTFLIEFDFFYLLIDIKSKIGQVNRKEMEIQINDPILTLKSKSSYNCHLNLDCLESEWSTIRFWIPNCLSLSSWDEKTNWTRPVIDRFQFDQKP